MEKVIKNGKELKTGYTTGSCAAAATKAALIYFFTKEKVDEVTLDTPKGVKLTIKVLSVVEYNDYIESVIIKESGDVPDVTNGIKISAMVYAGHKNLIIDGGIGVGRVTKNGLKIPVGSAAINPVPRAMIEKEVEQFINNYGYEENFKVIINAYNGEEIAKKTFNSRLGIIGGISIIGTTGIVEPMSEKALIDTIHSEINIALSEGRENILLTPGNYGRDAAYEKFGIDIDKGIKISNYIGDTLDYLLYKKPKRILIIGHAGKLSKIAGGIMNTHSSYADCRHEIFSSYAALVGAEKHIIEEIFESVSTDEIDSILLKYNLHEKVWDMVMERVYANINRRLQASIPCEIIIFTNKEKTWKYSKNSLEFTKYFKERLHD